MSQDDQSDKIAAAIRELNKFESEQVHRRLSWLGTMQGLLFTALAFGWGKDPRLAKLISALGIAVSVLIFIGMISGVLGVLRLRRLWLKHRPQHSDGIEIFSFFPDSDPWMVFTAPEVLLPVVFAAAWVVILILAST